MFQTYSDLFTLAHPEEFFIGGKWVKPQGNRRLEVVYPATEKVIARPPEASVADINAAVAAARLAFDEGPWARMSYHERGTKLLQAAEIMKRRAADFSKSWTAEMGCAVSLAGPGGFSPYGIFAYYGNMVLKRTFEEIRPQSRSKGVGIVVKEPVGVVAAITPWNAPASLSCKIIAPALATGCSVILKPAPETPSLCMADRGVPRRSRLAAGHLQLRASGSGSGRQSRAPPRCRQGQSHRVHCSRPTYRAGLRSSSGARQSRVGWQVTCDCARRHRARAGHTKAGTALHDAGRADVRCTDSHHRPGEAT